jgi:hypothetical protein
MLHGSEATITAIHCSRIVFSMPVRPGGMHFRLVAWGSIKRLAQARRFFLVVYKLQALDCTPAVRRGRSVEHSVPSGFESE